MCGRGMCLISSTPSSSSSCLARQLICLVVFRPSQVETDRMSSFGQTTTRTSEVKHTSCAPSSRFQPIRVCRVPKPGGSNGASIRQVGTQNPSLHPPRLALSEHYGTRASNLVTLSEEETPLYGYLSSWLPALKKKALWRLCGPITAWTSRATPTSWRTHATASCGPRQTWAPCQHHRSCAAGTFGFCRRWRSLATTWARPRASCAWSSGPTTQDLILVFTSLRSMPRTLCWQRPIRQCPLHHASTRAV
mmetsp:Transcript_130181/g.308864  ORF Transcript_130181/g.308864 Transcript_130181/m.308864 type:complete len:249 (+) Transcript_130181:5533-6279(+)